MQTNVASTCTECGGVFPADDLIRHENARVCVKCKPAFLQKLAEGAEFKTSMRYAGFWLRFGAVLLDGIILFVVNLGLGMLIGLSATQAIGTEQGSIALLLIVYMIQLAVGISYETIMIGKFGYIVGSAHGKESRRRDSCCRHTPRVCRKGCRRVRQCRRAAARGFAGRAYAQSARRARRD